MLILLLGILISFQVIEVDSINLHDYCSIKCLINGVVYPHTVCLREEQQCKPNPSCGQDVLLDMTDKVRKAILDKHNELRNNIAAGHQTSQPGASNMNVLNWNFELEYIAQCLANTCNFKHDACRRTSNYSVGQNLAILRHSSPDGLTLENTVNLMMGWYNEVNDMDEKYVDKFPSGYTGPTIGHYTQLAWADVEYVGCGRIKYIELKNGKKWHTLYLVCNYMGKQSSGNLLGNPIYKKGPSCSQCDDKNCNSYYKNLCGEITPLQYLEKDIEIDSSSGSAVNKVLLITNLFILLKILLCKNILIC